MDGAKRKVTVKVNYNNDDTFMSSSRPASRSSYITRPNSPIKSPTSSSLSPAAVPRPKAKINSSAVGVRKTASLVSTSSRTSTLSGSNHATPRALSPSKPPPRSAALSPSSQHIKTRTTVRANLRPHTAQTPPDPHYPSPTSDSTSSNGLRSRNSSVSLHHTISSPSLGAPSGSMSPDYPVNTDYDHEARDTKIKSKVSSGLAKPSDTLSPSPILHPPIHRNRAPSISSSLSSTAPPQTFYPITTATPAANPYRFATARVSPPVPPYHHYQPFTPRDDLHLNYNRRGSFTLSEVDPTYIPLPPQSPPTSALSFSSRSSVSRSSASFTADTPPGSQKGSYANSNGSNTHTQDVVDLKLNLENLVSFHDTQVKGENSSGDSGHDPESENELNSQDRKVKAEAKSIRKIADLEITNRSLLAINASLETAKHRQAKEIRELRRKLRESRLILPPRAYRAVKSSLEPADVADDEEDEEEDNVDLEGETGDELYQRVKLMVESLLQSGRRALDSKPEDFIEGGKGGAKVLSAEEVRDWRDSSGGVDLSGHSNGLDDSVDYNREGEGGSISPLHAILPGSDIDVESEDEVEAMMLAHSHPSRTPPIHVTESL